MVPLGDFLIMAGTGLVVAIVGWGSYGIYLAAQRALSGMEGALAGLAAPKGIAQIKGL